MNFLYPAFLLGALAVAIPIALHLLRRDVAPDMPFTAVRLLRPSPVERSRRRRLRDLLLLAARVTALLLLAAAFARPFASATASALQPLRIVAIDRSFSMAAPGTFARAIELARAAIGEAGFNERVAVIAFDDRAEVLVQPGTAAEARAALAALGPGHGATSYIALMRKASELAAGADARLIVISDFQRAGLNGAATLPIPATLKVEPQGTGAPVANSAVVAARHDAKGLVASIRNSSAAERAGMITVSQHGAELARTTWKAGAHTTVDVPIEWRPAAGGVTLAIDDPGGFAADNARHVIIGPPASAAVLVVTSPDSAGFYLARALEAADADGGAPLPPRLVTAAEIAGGRAAAIGAHRAVVLLSTRGLDRSARDGVTTFVRGGGGLLVTAAPQVEPDVITAMFGWPPGQITEAASRDASLTATDARHPIFRPFGPLAANLGQARFTRAWRVDPSGWHVAAHFDDGSPAVLERREGAGRIVLFASDVDRRWNDFPLHPSFVPFIVESVRHVASRRIEPDGFVVGRVPAGVNAAPGIHRMADGRVIAVNVEPGESSTSVLTAEEFTAALQSVQQPPQQYRVRDEQTESRQNLWQIGLVMMLGALVVESFVGRAQGPRS